MGLTKNVEHQITKTIYIIAYQKQQAMNTVICDSTVNEAALKEMISQWFVKQTVMREAFM